MIDSLFGLLPFDVILNATNVLPDQVMNTVASNTGLADTGTTLSLAGLGSLGLKAFLDNKSKKERSDIISQAVQILISDNEDNFRENLKFLDLFKYFLDTAINNPTLPIADLLKQKYDLTGDTTIGQRFAKYIEDQHENYESYYGKESPNIDGLHSRDPLKRSLAIVKSKTSPA